MTENIFKALQQWLRNHISGLAEVEWFLHQYDEDGNFYQVGTPSLYIEFADMQFSDQGQNAQECVMALNIHIMNEALFSDSSRITDIGIGHSQLVNNVYKAMQGKSFLLSEVPGNEALAGTADDRALTGPFTRIRQQPDHRYTNLLCTVMTLSGFAMDESAMPVYGTATPALNVTRG